MKQALFKAMAACVLLIGVAMPPVQGAELVRVTANPEQTKKPRDATLCGIASDRTGGQFETLPLSDVLQTLQRKDRPKTRSLDIVSSVSEATTIVNSPKYGKIESPPGDIAFTYRPDDGFEGEDRFTLKTVYNGRVFILRYRINVLVGDVSFAWESDCSKPPFSNPKKKVPHHSTESPTGNGTSLLNNTENRFCRLMGCQTQHSHGKTASNSFYPRRTSMPGYTNGQSRNRRLSYRGNAGFGNTVYKLDSRLRGNDGDSWDWLYSVFRLPLSGP
jgi:hypothetical protein